MKADHTGPLYSIVAWPTAELGEWLAALQKRLGVSSYGDPHLNLRVPFAYSGDEKELVTLVRAALEDIPALEVEFLRWRRFPHVVFLEYALTVRCASCTTSYLICLTCPFQAMTLSSTFHMFR